MAIVAMKRIGIVGPRDGRDPLLKELQDLALVDPEPMVEVEEPPPELVARRTGLQRVLGALQLRRRELKKEAPEPSVRVDHRTAIAALERCEKLLARRAELENKLSALRKEHDQLAPWGDLDPADLALLADHGVYLRLYQGQRGELDGLDLSGARWTTRIDLGGKAQGLAVLALDEPVAIELDPVTLPPRSLRAITDEIRQAEATLEKDAEELGRLSANIPALQRYDQHLQDRLRMAEVRAGVGGDEELFALSGWCPEEKVEELQRLVRGQPLALVVRDPADDEDPPIELRNPPLIKHFEPLLKMFNLPNYREYDPTLYIAPFMGIFFGFCLGDFGYGVVLLVLAALAWVKFKPKGQGALITQWMMILGVSTMLIGGLTGNVFGVKAYEVFDLPPSQLLFSLNDDPKKFFYASLLFGVVQLTLGMLLRMIRQIQLGQWQHVLGTLGWLAIMPSIGVWAIVGTPWVFVGALVVILLFASPSPSVVRRLGGGAWALYNISGLAGDVMSYVRIFGLGLSSAILAMVVNTIAMLLADIPIVGWPIAIVFLLAGHTFNFGMAMIGSVVHPARLQFLEFFGKFFEGGGRPYTPFAKLEGE